MSVRRSSAVGALMTPVRGEAFFPRPISGKLCVDGRRLARKQRWCTPRRTIRRCPLEWNMRDGVRPRSILGLDYPPGGKANTLGPLDGRFRLTSPSFRVSCRLWFPYSLTWWRRECLGSPPLSQSPLVPGLLFLAYILFEPRTMRVHTYQHTYATFAWNVRLRYGSPASMCIILWHIIICAPVFGNNDSVMSARGLIYGGAQYATQYHRQE